MIWLSEYRDVFIKNSFGLVYENSLLLTSTNLRGDYIRPYSHNLGLSPNKNNNFIGKPLTAWPKKVDHYTSSASLFIAAYL